MIARVLVLLAIAAPGCRDRGVIDIEVSLPAECAAPTHVAVYLMRGALCDGCRCGDCLERCAGDSCTVGCDGGFCSFEEFLDGGVDVTPDEPGSYAVVYQFVQISGDVVTELSAACVDDVQLDKDGAESKTVEAAAVCCDEQQTRFP